MRLGGAEATGRMERPDSRWGKGSGNRRAGGAQTSQTVTLPHWMADARRYLKTALRRKKPDGGD